MARISKTPILKDFQLSTDSEGTARITVRQATEGDNIERAELFSKTTRVYDDDYVGEVRLETDYNPRRLHRKEAYLTLASVTGIQDENGTELFRSGSGADGARVRYAMTEGEFDFAWGLLPAEMTGEITRCVLEVNRTWDFNRSGE